VLDFDDQPLGEWPELNDALFAGVVDRQLERLVAQARIPDWVIDTDPGFDNPSLFEDAPLYTCESPEAYWSRQAVAASLDQYDAEIELDRTNPEWVRMHNALEPLLQGFIGWDVELPETDLKNFTDDLMDKLHGKEWWHGSRKERQR
jgi:hypothetical protein